MFIIVHPYEWNMFLTFIILGLFKVIVCSHQVKSPWNHHLGKYFLLVPSIVNMQIQVIHWFSSDFFRRTPQNRFFWPTELWLKKVYIMPPCVFCWEFFSGGSMAKIRTTLRALILGEGQKGDITWGIARRGSRGWFEMGFGGWPVSFPEVNNQWNFMICLSFFNNNFV